MRTHLRTWAVVGLTAGLLTLFLRNVNLADVGRELRGASGPLLVLAVAFQAVTYIVRSWRWQVLLEPVGRVGLALAVRTTVIGFAANALLPARAGEVLRPYLLARRTGLSATSAFATIIVERLLDLAMVALLFGVFVLLAHESTLAADRVLFETVQTGGVLAALGALLLLGVLAVLAGHPERLARVTDRSTRVLPARASRVLTHAVRTFARGLAVMRRPALLGRALLLTVPLWISIAAGIWLVARAFHITMPFSGSFLIVALLTVGVAAPTPGAVGGFHYAFRLGATVFYGVSTERAVGAAIVLHAVSFVPVALVGLIFMVQDGLTLGRLRELARDSALDDRGADTVADRGEAAGAAALAAAAADGGQRRTRA